jgi:hypothetical protein
MYKGVAELKMKLYLWRDFVNSGIRQVKKAHNPHDEELPNPLDKISVNAKLFKDKAEEDKN